MKFAVSSGTSLPHPLPEGVNRKKIAMNKLPISVVVCAKNSEATMAECLESIQNNHPTEIIVMDGNSTDRTQEIAQGYTDKICVSDKGLGYQRQLGAEQATEDYIIYVDSDVIVPTRTLEIMLGELITDGYVGIQAEVRASSVANYWEWARQEDLNLTYNHPGEAKSGISAMTALWRREIILKYKFDPFFSGAYEDGDISHRVSVAGHKLGCSQAFVYHHHRSTLGRFIRQKYWHGQGCAHFIWKHKFFLGLPNLISPISPLNLLKCLTKREPRLLPYFIVGDLSHWGGMTRELARLLVKRPQMD